MNKTIEWDGDTLYRIAEDGKRKLVGHVELDRYAECWDVIVGRKRKHRITSKDSARQTLENYA